MALMNTAGTPKKVMINGAWFDVIADCKPMINLSGVRIETNATSGSAIYVITKEPKYVKSVDVKMSLSEYNLLAMVVGGPAGGISLPNGITLADFTTVTGAGRCHLGDFDGAANKCSVDLYFDQDVVVAG